MRRDLPESVPERTSAETGARSGRRLRCIAMKHRILAALAALAFAGATGACAGAQTTGHSRLSTLTVTGDAEVTRAPDRATVSFQIETNNEQAAAATSANAAIANALTAKLAPLHIPASAVSTSGYSLNYTPRPPKPDPASTMRYGFTVSRTIEVVVDDVNGAGAVVDAGVAAGVTNVNGISLRDRRAAVRSAEGAALADAQAQAGVLATAAKVRLVRILAIAPADGSAPIRPVGRVMFAAAASVPTTIDPGSLTINASVTLQYAIEPVRP